MYSTISPEFLMKLMVYEEWIDSIHEKDGINKDRERQMRYEVVSFMTSYGIFFKLPQVTIAKGITIFHQVSKQISFKKFDRILFGGVCVFLASKLDDHPKPIKEFIKAFDYMHSIHKKQMLKNASNPHFEASYAEITEDGYKAYKIDSKKQADLEEKFTGTEIEILKMIGYDLVIELPYHHLENLKNSILALDVNFFKTASTFLNDSMRTILCLYYEPRVIALAAVNLTSAYYNYKLPQLENHKEWFTIFGEDIGMDIIEEVSLQIMDIYKRFTFLSS